MKSTKTANLDSTKTLSKSAQKIRERILSEYQLDQIGLVILQNALDAYDRMRQATATIKREGATYKDRFGQPHQHPAVLTENMSRLTMLRHMRALGLETGEVTSEVEDEL